MKKKAIVSTVVSMALAGAMCVGFAACGGESAESMKGEEVTAEEWAAAFAKENFRNVKIEIKANATIELMGTSGKSKGESRLVVADGKAYYKMNSTQSADGKTEKTDKEQYEEETATGEIIVYTQNSGGAWVEDANADSMALTMITRYTGLATQYDSFEYSADKKGYVKKSAYEGELLIYKFRDGKLAAIWDEVDATTSLGASGSMKTRGSTGTLFTYGGQSVTLPTIG